LSRSNRLCTLSRPPRGLTPFPYTTLFRSFVGGTDYTDSLTVATADGTTKLLTVTMHGTDDATVITGTSTAELTETNAAQNTGGRLEAHTSELQSRVQLLSRLRGGNDYWTF